LHQVGKLIHNYNQMQGTTTLNYAFHYRSLYNLTTTNTVTRLRAGQSRVQILSEARNIFSKSCTPALRPTQPPIQ